MRYLKFIKNLSLIYLIVIFSGFFFSLFLPDFPQGGTLGPGCYWGFTLIVADVDCRGFPLSNIFEIYLGAWLLLVYSVILPVMAGKIILSLVVLFVFMWSPIFYLIWYGFKGRHLTNSSKTDAVNVAF